MSNDTDLTKDIKSRALPALMVNTATQPHMSQLDITFFLDPRFKTDYISADNVPDIKKKSED